MAAGAGAADLHRQRALSVFLFELPTALLTGGGGCDRSVGPAGAGGAGGVAGGDAGAGGADRLGGQGAEQWGGRTGGRRVLLAVELRLPHDAPGASECSHGAAGAGRRAVRGTG